MKIYFADNEGNPEAKPHQRKVFAQDTNHYVILPFTVGDLVRIVDSGEQYSSYESAMKLLSGKLCSQFKNGKGGELHLEDLLNKNDKDAKKFIVRGLALHESTNDVLAWITNRFWTEEYIIGVDGLKLFRQSPKVDKDYIIQRIKR